MAKKQVLKARLDFMVPVDPGDPKSVVAAAEAVAEVRNLAEKHAAKLTCKSEFAAVLLDDTDEAVGD